MGQSVRAAREISPTRLFGLWLQIGFQSFGGGPATLTLIRQVLIERLGLITEAEFNEDWAVCQLTPGINLIALVILLGRRIHGVIGIAAALVGLLLPSVVATAAITAFYAVVRDRPETKQALEGVIPATAGLGIYSSVQIMRPVAQDTFQRGLWQALFFVILLVASGIGVLALHVPVPIAILVGGVLLAFLPSRVSPVETLEVVP